MSTRKQARIAALSLEQGAVIARLLKSSGRPGHAARMEAALCEAREILSDRLGRQALNDALDWVAEQSDRSGDEERPLIH